MINGWINNTIGEICTKITDGSHNPPKGLPYPTDFKMISSQNVFNDVLDCSDVRYLSEADFSLEDKRTRIRRGDVLLTIVGTIGRCAVVKGNEGPITLQRSVAVLSPTDEVLPRFLMYALMGNRENLERESHGIAQKGIYLKQLSKFKISRPKTIDEQQRIVNELDLLASIIDKKNAQLRDLDALAQSIFYEMFGDPAVNEKGWPVKKISDLFDVGSSKRVFESEWRDSGVPFYRAREIVRLSKGLPLEDPIFIEESLFTAYKEKYGIPAAGDIMVTGVGTLGICYLVKEGDRFYFKDGNTLWFKDKHVSNSRFIKDQFLTEFVKDQIKGNSHGATVGTYTIVNAKKTRVICPPVKLQNEYEERVNAIDSQKRVIGKSLTETQNLLDSRMHNYFG